MDCPSIPKLGVGAFSQRMRAKVIRERVPLSGSLELTLRCNLRCQHCYLDSVHDDPSKKELTTAEICNLFDQVVDEGTLWMLITGGEPLLRRDFSQIYLHAKRKGLLVNLFTNGTLITERIADMLAEWKPFSIEITLYGRTQATYEQITGVPGSHARCLAGIERLLERGLPLSLKTMAMTLNQHEVLDMQEYANSLGVEFRFDPMLNMGLEGNRQPVTLRLLPEEVVRFDVIDEKRRQQWNKFLDQFNDRPIDTSNVYVCDAGKMEYHIDPYGQLSLCILSRTPAYDLRHGTFRQGWRDFIPNLRFQPATEESGCDHCKLLALCGQCPGWSQLEQGSPRAPVDYLCQVATLRAKALGYRGLPPFRGNRTSHPDRPLPAA